MSMNADAKMWAPPKETRDFHYHITDVAVRRFRERVDAELKNLSERDLALVLDKRIFRAFELKREQAILVDGRSDQGALIAVVHVREGLECYAQLRMYRPNAYPPLRIEGGPAGAGLACINLLPLEAGSENFARGIWKPSLNRPFAEKSAAEKIQELVNNTIVPPRISTPGAPKAEPTTPGDVTMDADTSRKPTSAAHWPAGSTAAKERMAKARAAKATKPKQEKPMAKMKRAGGTGRPPGFKDPVKTQQRIDFAKAQLAIRPYMSIGGPDGLRKMMTDRFGVAVKAEILNQLRSEAQKASGKTGTAAIGRLKVNPKTGQPLNPKRRPSAPTSTVKPAGTLGKRQQYSDADRIAAVQAVLQSGKPPWAMAKELSLTPSALCRWMTNKSYVKAAMKEDGKSDQPKPVTTKFKIAVPTDMAGLAKELGQALQDEAEAVQILEDAKKRVSELLAAMQAARA